MRTGAEVTMPRHLYRSAWSDVIRAATVGAIIGVWIVAGVLVIR